MGPGGQKSKMDAFFCTLYSAKKVCICVSGIRACAEMDKFLVLVKMIKMSSRPSENIEGTEYP